MKVPTSLATSKAPLEKKGKTIKLLLPEHLGNMRG